MSNHAAGTRCSASMRPGFSRPKPFFKSTHYYHGLLGVSLLGCIAGVALVMACAKVLAGMLYGVSPSDPATLAGVVAIVLVVAAAASLVPASSAARLEPMEVLRDE